MIATFPTLVERLCQGVYLRHEPERLFLMLGTFVDESGTHDGSSRTVMVGCLATVEQWANLEVRWSAILSAYGLKYVHAKELRQGSGPFKNWSFEKRSALTNQLFSALEGRLKFCLAVILDNHEFEVSYRSRDKQRQPAQQSRVSWMAGSSPAMTNFQGQISASAWARRRGLGRR